MKTTATTPTAADLQRVFDAHAGAWNAADAEQMAGAYAADGRLLDPFGGVADGVDAVTARFAEIHATVMRGTTTECTVETVRPLADQLAVVDGTQTVDGITAPDGTRLPELSLHFTAVLRHDGDEWRIVECRPYAFLPTV